VLLDLDWIPPSALLAAARDAAWPAVAWGGSVEHGGEAAWSRAVYHATPGERARLLGLLSPALTAYGPGAERMRQWAAEHPSHHPIRPAERRRHVRHALRAYGDEMLLDCVVAAVSDLPTPVQAVALDACAFFLVGAGCTGWTSPNVFAPAERPDLVVVSGRDWESVRHVTAHEVAHVWQRSPTPAGITSPTCAATEGVLALAREQAWPALDTLPAREQRAELLACSWLLAAAESRRGGAA
jgi:hypothetical protein